MSGDSDREHERSAWLLAIIITARIIITDVDVGNGWQGIYPVVSAPLFAIRLSYFNSLHWWEERTGLQGSRGHDLNIRDPACGLCGPQSLQGRKRERLRETPL